MKDRTRRRIIFIIVTVATVAILDLSLQLHAQMTAPTSEVDVIKAYRLSRPAPYADSPYWSRAFVLDYYNLTERLTNDDYWVMNDYHSQWYNITNGERRTVGQPAQYDHTLWLFGNSLVFDTYVPDDYTAATQLQAMINRTGQRIRVVNLGVSGVTVDNERQHMKFLPIKPGDIVVSIDGAIEGQTPATAANYCASVARMKAAALAKGATWYHFVQPFVGSTLDHLGGNQIEVPPSMFVDNIAHLNEHGDAIVARAIRDTIWRAF